MPQAAHAAAQPEPLASEPAILWPEAYQPARAVLHAQQEQVIAASPDAVWACLLAAETWPAWQPAVSDIHFLSHAGPHLRDRSRLRWTLAGTRLTSKVLEFEPCVRLGWDVRGLGIEGYHAWVLTPEPGGSTRVLSAEVRSGWRTKLTRLFAPGSLAQEQTRWLKTLNEHALHGQSQRNTPA